MAIVEAVAAEMGVRPDEMPTPIFDAVDPDALDALFSSSQTGQDTRSVEVTFEYEGFEVVASSDGHFEVKNPHRAD